MSRQLSAIDQAKRALAHAHDDPAESERAATALLGDTVDPEARQAAAWARGRARHERGAFAGALEDFRVAATLAAERGDAVGQARIDANRALTQYAVGDVDGALASLRQAEPMLVGVDAGHLHLQRAIIEVHAGELVRARHSFDVAHRLLLEAGDDAAVARCIASRGVASTYLGELDDAVADLTEAADRAAATGQRLVAAGATHNLGYVRARRGDVAEALELLGQARSLYRELASPARVVASLEQDRAEVLLQAGLAVEAVTAARAAVERHEAAGSRTASDDARLLLAEAELAAGRTDAAIGTAESCATRFVGDGREAWAARARYVALRAELADIDRRDAPPSPELFDRACVLAGVLDRCGWWGEAVDVRTFAGRIGLALGRSDDARPLLRTAAAARHTGPVATRLRGWHAAALHRLADGDATGARRAARQGLRLVAEHRRALVATELRAGAARHGIELARLGLRVAVSDGRPAQVFAWIEETKARSLASAVGAPDDDPELRALLGRLRGAHAELRSAPGSADARRDVEALEGAIRDRAHRRTAGGARSGSELVVDLRPLRAGLGACTFVSFAELDGRVLSVAVTGRRTALRDHGTAGAVAATVERLRFAVQRLARRATARSTAAAMASFDADRRHLDDLLELGSLPAGALVVAPTATLAGVPWPALPSVAGRPVTLTPSASVWAAPVDRAPPGRPACFVAGPRLPAARREIRSAAAHHPGSTVVEPEQATVGTVVGAFPAHRLLHVAAHGTFRSDSPLFSGLELADGALTLFDLRGLAAAPDTVILPACHLGTARVLPGDEPLGAVATLVELGVRTVVAPTGAVPDEEAATLMTDLHARLAGGLPVADALAAAASQAFDGSEPGAVACAASFVATGRR